MTFSGVTILQGVEFRIFVLIFAWALQQSSATVLPVITKSKQWLPFPVKVCVFCNFVTLLLCAFLVCLHSAVLQVSKSTRITVGA